VRSRRHQSVAIGDLGLRVELAAGELIHVENSYKYSPEEIEVLARGAGLRLERRWVDSGGRFTSVLLAPA
jgi:uncharacterized SAM-dependent methyltransferase